MHSQAEPQICPPHGSPSASFPSLWVQLSPLQTQTFSEKAQVPGGAEMAHPTTQRPKAR